MDRWKAITHLQFNRWNDFESGGAAGVATGMEANSPASRTDTQTAFGAGMVKQKEQRSSASTRIGAYPLGSVGSRAAARQIIESRRAKSAVSFLIRLRDSSGEIDKSKCTCRQPKAGEVVLCKCFLSGSKAIAEN